MMVPKGILVSDPHLTKPGAFASEVSLCVVHACGQAAGASISKLVKVHVSSRLRDCNHVPPACTPVCLRPDVPAMIGSSAPHGHSVQVAAPHAEEPCKQRDQCAHLFHCCSPASQQVAYGQSKLAQILFTRQLQRRLGEASPVKVRSLCAVSMQDSRAYNYYSTWAQKGSGGLTHHPSRCKRRSLRACVDLSSPSLFCLSVRGRGLSTRFVVVRWQSECMSIHSQQVEQVFSALLASLVAVLKKVLKHTA